MNYVYWIFDDSCTDVTLHGYVGVTSNVDRRFATHVRNGRVPSDSKIKVLLEATREECFEYEKTLRPKKSIGWNNAVGGSHGWKLGFQHGEEAKTKMKAAWSNDRKDKASAFKTEHNKSLSGQKRPKQSESMKGENNPMFGTSRPDHVKEAVSRAHRGKTPMNKQQIYCIGCRQRASLSILHKYHNKCVK